MSLISVADLKKKEIENLIKIAKDLKANPKKYNNKLKRKVLLTFFQMPSLRTKVSFDMAMYQMGGNVISYNAENSPWGAGKESIGDVAKVLSRYVDAVMIRMHDHEELQKFMSHATVPVINGLTSYEHPCQILSDLLTIKEHKGKLKGLHLVYFGDSFNNVTHSLILAAAIMGMDITIVCPKKKSYSPDPKIIKQAKKLGKIKIVVTNKKEACKGADIIYTDSWISYRIPKSERKKHASNLKNCQVTKQVMKLAPKAMFMHDLPALRGMEVTKDVIDGKQSVVFDQAENRLHMQKAILLKLLSS